MNPTRPEFIRLPEDGEHCPHTGLKRGTMRHLCVPSATNGFKPAVPAKCLRQPGKLRGIWLVPFAALLAYLEALPTGVAGENLLPRGRKVGGQVEAGQPAGALRSRRSAGANRGAA
jgi:hypothetical protein